MIQRLFCFWRELSEQYKGGSFRPPADDHIPVERSLSVLTFSHQLTAARQPARREGRLRKAIQKLARQSYSSMHQDSSKAAADPDWSELPPELLARAFKQLAFHDLLQAERCCCNWRQTLKAPQVFLLSLLCQACRTSDLLFSSRLHQRNVPVLHEPGRRSWLPAGYCRLGSGRYMSGRVAPSPISGSPRTGRL